MLVEGAGIDMPSSPHPRCQSALLAAGEVGVDRGGLQIRVPEPARDDVERHVLFQCGDGESVPEPLGGCGRPDDAGDVHRLLHPAVGGSAVHSPQRLIGVLTVAGVVDQLDHFQQFVRHRDGPVDELPPLQRAQREGLGHGIDVQRRYLQRLAEPGAGEGQGQTVRPRWTRYEGFGGGDKGPPLLGGQILAQTARGEEARHAATLRDTKRGVNAAAPSTGRGVWQHRIAEIRRADQGSRFQRPSGCNIILG